MLFGIPDSVHPNLANEMYRCFVPLLSSAYNKLVIFFAEGKKVSDLYRPFWWHEPEVRSSTSCLVGAFSLVYQIQDIAAATS